MVEPHPVLAEVTRRTGKCCGNIGATFPCRPVQTKRKRIEKNISVLSFSGFLQCSLGWFMIRRPIRRMTFLEGFSKNVDIHLVYK